MYFIPLFFPQTVEKLYKKYDNRKSSVIIGGNDIFTPTKRKKEEDFAQ